jgi:peptidoglycan/LPS O-acetylase OafA/YrhL
MAQKPARLHYIDWLRILAILGVFLFHAVHPFDDFEWEIKNVETSLLVTLFIVFFVPWGMSFFFLISGMGSWFALRRRTSSQYALERFSRLLIPFIVGSILLSPIQFYLQWQNKLMLGEFDGTLAQFFAQREISIGPRIFGFAGYHLWFLGFLFAFSILALPIFRWFKDERGNRLIAWLGGWVIKKGGILIFILPILAAQLIFRPFFPEEHDWADFAFMFVFFISGFILMADHRFVQAARRDWPITLSIAIVTSLIFFALGVEGSGLEWMEDPRVPGFYLIWITWCINGWGWSITMFNVGIRFLDFRNEWLQYGQEVIMPFFLLHQPVIIAVAFFVVQWDVGITPKLLAVLVGSFLITVAIYELLLKRIGVIRNFFGLNTSMPIKSQVKFDGI